MAGKLKPIEPRFWANVTKAGPDECWEWRASKTPAGYGKICVFGKGRMAHRVSFWMATGEDLEGDYYVCHKCDNPGCVNPAHLWKGDNSQNIDDAYSKGRMCSQKTPEKLARGESHYSKTPAARENRSERQQGEKSHFAKITAQTAAEIHRMRATGMTHQKIADALGIITREQVGHILSGQCFADQATPEALQSHAGISGRAKLTPDIVRYIRATCAAGSSQASIAREVGVTNSVVCEIVNRRAWAHVE